MADAASPDLPSGGVFPILDGVVTALLFVSKLLILLMAAHIVADAAIRAVSDFAIAGTIEIASNYYMVALTFLPLAYIQRQRGHLIAEIFTQKLRPGSQRLLDALNDILMAAFLAFLVYHSGGIAIAATEAREYVELPDGNLPIWPAKWAVPVGFGVMALCALVQAGAILFSRRGPSTGAGRV